MSTPPPRLRSHRRTASRSGLPVAADRALRATFGLAERAAPRVAGRVAAALFTRLPPSPGPQRRQRDFTVGELFSVEVAGRRVTAERWGSGPVVQLVHGWGGWRQQLGTLVQPLVELGFTVVSHDAPSHGDSAPGALGRGRTTMLELAEALAAVADTVGPPTAVVAHSGAAVATLHAMRRPDTPLRPARLALVAPSVHTADMLSSFGDRFGVGPRGLADMVARLEGRFDFRLAELDAPRAVTALGTALPELLVVHDHDDAETPWQGSADLVAAWPGARLISSSGLGHHRVIWDARTTEAVTEFVAGPR